jgi:hypothetical protein
MSPALRVALSIAVMRLPCSDAAVSSSARKIWTGHVARQQLGQDLFLAGSYSTAGADAARWPASASPSGTG